MPGTGTEAMSSVFPAILNSFSRFLLLLLLPPGRRTFLHRGQARGAISETLQRLGNSQLCTSLVAGDQRPRGVYRLLRIHLGLLHIQFRISGMSSPFLSMYCLCSIS